MERSINRQFLAKYPIITLTTDLGLSDFYVAAAKGAMVKRIPQIQIVDISHDIVKYDIMMAAFNLRHAYSHFPEGTVHIVSINDIEDEQTPHVAMKMHGHYFIGADSGLFSLVFDQEAEEIVQLNSSKNGSHLFPLLQSFVEPAALLLEGKKLASLGRKIHGFKKLLMPAATRGEGLIRGSFIYQDSYGNMVTNIRKPLFDEVGNGHPFTINLRNTKLNLNKMHNSYTDVGEGDLVAMFNHVGFLEIALNKTSAARLLGLKVSDSIRIEFHDNPAR